MVSRFVRLSLLLLSVHVPDALVLVVPGGGIIDMMNTRLQNRLTEGEILKIFSDVVEVRHTPLASLEFTC